MFGSVGARCGVGCAALVMAAVMLGGGGAPASAQSAPAEEESAAPATGDKKEALRRLAQGDKKLQRGDYLTQRGRIEQAYAQYEAALLDYQSAYEAYRDPQIFFPIAQAEQRLGRFVDALQHYQELLAESKALSTALREQVQFHLDEVRKNLAAVVLEVEPEGATIAIDDKQVARSPMSQPVFVEPGQHSYRVSRDGYETAEGRVDLQPGKELRKQIQLKRTAPVVDPLANRDKEPVPEVPAVDRPSSLPVWIGVGLTGALLATGTFTGIAAASKHGTYEDESRDLAEREAARSDGKSLARTTDFLLGGALVVGGVTAYYYFAHYRPRVAEADRAEELGDESDEEALRVEPVVGDGVAGLVVSGTFW